MKTKNSQFLCIAFSMIIGFSSCTIEKRLYQPGYNTNWLSLNKKNKTLENDINYPSKTNYDTLTTNFKKLNTKQNYVESKKKYSENIKTSTANEEINLIASTENNQLELQTTNQKSLLTQIVEATQDAEQTLKANPKKSFSKIFTKSDDDPYDDDPDYNNRHRRLSGMALTGFILSLLGFGLLALIFSSIGLSQTNGNPSKWSGKGFAITGFILSILEIFVIVFIVMFSI